MLRKMKKKYTHKLEFLLFLFTLVVFLFGIFLWKWCLMRQHRKLHNGSGDSKSNNNGNNNDNNKKKSQARCGTTMTCKHSPQVIIQVPIIPPVHYAEQSFSYCHIVITLSLCSLLLQIISITDNLNVMRVARAKRFSQWPITLPPCWVCLYSLRPKERLNQFTYMQRKKKVANWNMFSVFISVAINLDNYSKRPREVPGQVIIYIIDTCRISRT